MKDFNDYHETNSDTKTLKRIWQYIKPYKFKFILAFGLMIITILGDVLLPLAFGMAVDYMSSPNHSFEHKILVLFIGAAVIVIFLIIIQIIAFYQQLILQKIGFKVTQAIRNDVFAHIEELSIAQINSLPVGKLVTRVMNDPNAISDMFTNVIVSFVRNILLIIAYLLVLFIINIQMSAIILTLFPVIIIASFIFQRFSRKAFRQVRNNLADVNAFLSENISGVKITQVFNQEEKKINEFKTKNQKLRKSHMTEIILFGIYRPFVYVVGMAGIIITIYFGARNIASGALLIGAFISFYTIVLSLFEPVQQISEQFNAFQNGFASAEKVFDVLDTKPTIVDDVDAIELKEFSGSIEFKNVWFSYVEDEWVLKDVSFKVNPDETVAFVGATGSGKTTILALIVRNYDIQKGEILIDGINIKKIKRSSLRVHIGQMMQDVFLFSGTIRENITLNNPNITELAVKEAAEYVGLDKIMSKFDQGYDHKVLERGNNFSSGERQLISFARAIVYQPSLMILDEATANIDSETEAIIQESLTKMMSISTMLIVAHRLSTIQHSDKIIVMQKGEIKEMGSHQELLKQHGIYYNLYQLQFDQK